MTDHSIARRIANHHSGNPNRAVIGFSAVIGVFFGLWPARRAALMDPITALGARVTAAEQGQVASPHDHTIRLRLVIR